MIDSKTAFKLRWKATRAPSTDLVDAVGSKALLALHFSPKV